MPTATGSRIEQLAETLQDEGIDAFFATSGVTMRYLAGLGEEGGERLLTLAINNRGETRLICPALSEQQARRAGIEDVRPWRDGEDPMAHIGQLAEDWNLKSAIIAVDDEMRASILLQLQAALPAALFKAGQSTLSALMRRKDSNEIAAMRKAGAIADKALSSGLEAIRPGATELEVAEALMSAMKRLGGAPTFCIVATGKNGAEPHHMSDSTRVAQGDVVIMDFGCDVDGYQSDITRTVCCGSASDEARRVYEVVLAAHMAARSAIKPGVSCGFVDRAAREVIEQAGYGEYFVHRTGHGIGMRVHEEPYIVGGSEVALLEGDCFSVEPGIYLPGKFGVRIENIVAVTKDGHESLNAEPAVSLLEIR